MRCKRCKRCDEVQAQDAFNFDQWKKATGSRCRKCEAQLERPGKRVTREGERKGMRQKAKVHYGEKGERDEMEVTEEFEKRQALGQPAEREGAAAETALVLLGAVGVLAALSLAL